MESFYVILLKGVLKKNFNIKYYFVFIEKLFIFKIFKNFFKDVFLRNCLYIFFC